MIKKLTIASLLAVSTMFASQSANISDISNVAFAKDYWVCCLGDDIDVDVTSIEWTSRSSF